MPLTEQQLANAKALAKERGVDVDKLIAEAEAMQTESSQKPGGPSASPNTKAAPDATAEKPKLFMYLLPFVTVREVREVWLGLTDAFSGDDEIASAWAAKQGGGGSTDPNAQ